MKIIGFHFNKINAEKFSNKFKELKLDTNIDISDIKEVKNTLLKSNNDLLSISFDFAVNYKPTIAKINLGGNILVEVEEKKSKEIIKKWKDKKVDEEFNFFIFNIILRKSNLKALQLEEELNLPIHIQLPSLKKKGNS